MTRLLNFISENSESRNSEKFLKNIEGKMSQRANVYVHSLMSCYFCFERCRYLQSVLITISHVATHKRLICATTFDLVCRLQNG